jgi:hypothetical protein
MMLSSVLFFVNKHVGNKLSFASTDVSSCTFTELRGSCHCQQRILHYHHHRDKAARIQMFTVPSRTLDEYEETRCNYGRCYM